jgi:hypothetical protein
MTNKQFEKRWAQFSNMSFGGFNSMPSKKSIKKYLLELVKNIDDFIISYDNGEYLSGGDTIFVKFKEKVPLKVFDVLRNMNVDEIHIARENDYNYCNSISNIYPRNNLKNWYRLWWD